MPIRRRPFWIHQLVEYLLGLVILQQGLQSSEPILPLVLGALVLANAGLVEGPLSVLPKIARPAHRGADVVVAVLVTAAALFGGSRVTDNVRWVLYLVAGLMAFLVVATDYTEPRRVARRRAARAAAANGTSPGARTTNHAAAPSADPTEDAGRSASPDRSEDLGRKAGRVAGVLYKTARNRKRR
ncbi:MAG: hypothetical protein R2715_12640 [Ilumatobacteraceae bacterium]